MTLALGLVLFGLLFVYAGVKGKSVTSLLLGDNQTPSKAPAPVDRGGSQIPQEITTGTTAGTNSPKAVRG